MVIIQNMIDYQFITSRKFAFGMLAVFVVFFYVPYFVLTLNIDQETNWKCFRSCLVTQILFLINEFIQMKVNGSAYFSEFLNYMELSHHFLYLYFARLKAADMNRTLMPPAKDTGADILLVNSLVSLTAFFKLFTFFRAIPSMAKMVILITQVASDLVPFIVIYALMLLQQLHSYTLVGVELYDSKKDY